MTTNSGQLALINTYDHSTERSIPAVGDRVLWKGRHATIAHVTDESSRYVLSVIFHDTGLPGVVLSDRDSFAHFCADGAA
jgi:hypothetical protein